MSDVNRCKTCGGDGRYLYPDTTLGMGGVGGQTMTEGPCPGWRKGKQGHRPDLSNCPHWDSPYDDYELDA